MTCSDVVGAPLASEGAAPIVAAVLATRLAIASSSCCCESSPLTSAARRNTEFVSSADIAKTKKATRKRLIPRNGSDRSNLASLARPRQAAYSVRMLAELQSYRESRTNEDHAAGRGATNSSGDLPIGCSIVSRRAWRAIPWGNACGEPYF